MLTILNTSNMCDMCNNVQIYKAFDFNENNLIFGGEK